MPEDSLHRLLLRQLRREGLDLDAPPSDAETWQRHLARVSAAYAQADDDRYLTQRSLQLSSSEMRALNESLRRASELRATERDRLQAVIGALGDAVVAMGSDGRITVVNRQAQQLLGRDREALTGRPLAEIVDIDWLGATGDGDLDALITMVIDELSTVRGDPVRFAVHGGDDFVASFVLSGFSEPEERGAVLAFRDVTEAWRDDRVHRALHEVGRAVAGGSPAFALVAAESAAIFDCDAMVFRFDEAEAVVVGAEGGHSTIGDRLPYGSGGALDGVRATGEAAIIEDYSSLPDDSPVRAHALAHGYRGTVAAPITVGGATWGALVVMTKRDRGVNDGTRRRLGRFAELVGLAIANRQARDELEALASTDPLTGLGNHRAFQESLRREIARARRTGAPLSLAVLDIDGFKRVNDDFGHQVGDEVLALVARCIGRATRQSDIACRVGGDEIAWILPDSDSHAAWQAVDRARELVGGEPLDGVGRVTISAGVSDLAAARDADELLRFADGALYWAKQHGRDCVIRYSPEVVKVLSDAERAEQLARQQALQSIRILARAVDAKDSSTREHSERVADLAVQLAHVLDWDLPRIAQLREAGLVHDVGKISVPDSILFKPAGLSEAELARVRDHATVGAEMVVGVLTEEQVGWIRGHHERWDGTGYPDRLAGDQIPDGARILAIADSWDVITTYRPYSPPRSEDEALAECLRCAGSQFWPEGVDALAQLVRSGALLWHGDPVFTEA